MDLAIPPQRTTSAAIGEGPLFSMRSFAPVVDNGIRCVDFGARSRDHTTSASRHGASSADVPSRPRHQPPVRAVRRALFLREVETKLTPKAKPPATNRPTMIVISAQFSVYAHG